MKLKKIKKNVAKLPIEKQIKLASWLEKFLQDKENNPALSNQRVTTESL